MQFQIVVHSEKHLLEYCVALDLGRLPLPILLTIREDSSTALRQHLHLTRSTVVFTQVSLELLLFLFLFGLAVR